MSCYINEKTGAMRIIVYGEPVAQERPKFHRTDQFVNTYDPKKSRNYKEQVCYEAAQLARMAKNMGYKLPYDGPLEFYLTVYRSIPKSLSKKDLQAARDHTLYAATMPDLDNYVKIALDGMGWKGNKPLFTNDSRIVKMWAEKKYDDCPRIEAWLKPME